MTRFKVTDVNGNTEYYDAVTRQDAINDAMLDGFAVVACEELI